MARLPAFVRTLFLTLPCLSSCWLALAVPTCLTSPQFEQRPLHYSPSNIHIRPATKADTDGITTVLADAFSPSELFHYIFPGYDQYKESYWACERKEVAKTLANLPANCFVNFISVPVSHSGSDSQTGRIDRVVAVAGWVILEPYPRPLESEPTDLLNLLHPTTKCSPNLYTNKTRLQDYSRQYDASEKRYVRRLPRKQLYLGILATHPDWDGHGFGAKHCLWGMELAKELGIPTTLIATPAGWPLYDELGFESVVNVSISTLNDWKGEFWDEYMRYES